MYAGRIIALFLFKRSNLGPPVEVTPNPTLVETSKDPSFSDVMNELLPDEEDKVDTDDWPEPPFDDKDDDDDEDDGDDWF